jgi:hypothetical protein
VSPYQEARQRRDRAVTAHLAALTAKAEADARFAETSAELADAEHELRRHAIDPEYRGAQHRKATAA